MTIAFYWVTLIPAIVIGMGVMAVGLRFAPELNMPEVEVAKVPDLSGHYRFSN